MGRGNQPSIRGCATESPGLSSTQIARDPPFAPRDSYNQGAGNSSKATSLSDVTCILSNIESGDPSAAEQLLPLVYDELRKLAAAKMAHEQPGQTLQATALVLGLKSGGDERPRRESAA